MGILPMDADILPPSDDRIFKLILTKAEAAPALRDLVSSIIGRPVTDVVVRNSEMLSQDTEEKEERLDVNCRVVEDGTQIDLEMQAHRIQEDDGDPPRNLTGKGIFYLCDLHSSQPSRGVRRYDRLAQTWQVTFCVYPVFPRRENFLNAFSLRHDEDNELLSDMIRIVYVELGKLQEILKKPIGTMTDLEKWAIFFRYANVPKYRKVVNEIIDSKEALTVAGELLMSVSKDEHERAVFRSRRMAETDRLSDLATAEERGERRGERRGIEKERKRQDEDRKIKALKLLSLGCPISFIEVATDLTADEIRRMEKQ